MTLPSVDDVCDRVAAAAFGRPLVTNVLRGQLVEAMVALAIEPDWTWCAHDYASWDFEDMKGNRLEVRQSAARQSWAADRPSSCSYDIAPRQGRWEGSSWIDAPGRAAHLYVFGHHPRVDDGADHRDVMQWTFYVVPTVRLPDVKRLSIGRLRTLTMPVEFSRLRYEIQTAVLGLH